MSVRYDLEGLVRLQTLHLSAVAQGFVAITFRVGEDLKSMPVLRDS